MNSFFRYTGIAILIFLPYQLASLPPWMIQAAGATVVKQEAVPAITVTAGPVHLTQVNNASLEIVAGQEDGPFSAFAGDVAFTTSLLNIQAQTASLFTRLKTLFAMYHSPVSSGFGLESAMSVVSFGTPIPPLMGNTSLQQSFQGSFLGGLSVDLIDTASFRQIQNLLNGPSGSGSFTDLLDQLWQLYAQEIQKIEQSGLSTATKDAQNVAQQPFLPGSYSLGIATQLVGQCIVFLKTRLGTFSTTTFGMSGAQYFLNTELPALDALVAQVTKQFNTYLTGKGQYGYPNVSSFASSQALSAYTQLQTSYTQQKSILISTFVFNLLQSLSASYQPALVRSGIVTDCMGKQFLSSDVTNQFMCLGQFCALAQTGLQQLNQNAPFLTYASPASALQALQQMLGNLYEYAALVGQNNLTQLCKSTDAVTYQSQMQTQSTSLVSTSSLTTTFVKTVQKVIAQTDVYYQNAGQAFASIDPAVATAYSYASAYLQQGLASWKKAENFVQNTDYVSAANAYQAAATLFKESDAVALAFMLSRKASVATLLYYQMSLSSYAQYYQSVIPVFVQQMSAAPVMQKVTAQDATEWHSAYPQGFIQLFYYDAGANPPASPPIFQGMAWLSGQAQAAYASLLNAYQTDTTPAGMQIKQSLASSLLILENLTQASQGLFYNDPLATTKSIKGAADVLAPQQMAANANIGSSTVKGVVEGCLQHAKVYELFTKVDASIAQASGAVGKNKTNPFSAVPFATLFQGLPVTGFADFSLLAQIYWMLMNIDPSLALASEYPTYTQTVVSAALILGTYAGALSTDPSLQQTLLQGYAGDVQKKVQTLLTAAVQGKTGSDLLLAQGDELLSKPETALDYEAACACYITAGLAGSTQAQQQYFACLQQFAMWYTTQSGLACSSLYAAFVYYRGYLAQQKGWATTQEYAQACQKALQQFSKELTTELSLYTQLIQEHEYASALTALGSLQEIADELDFIVVRQKREQQLFGLQGKDLFSVVQTTTTTGQVMEQVPVDFLTYAQPVVSYTTPLFKNVLIPHFIDPTYNSAQLYYEQGKGLFTLFKNAFKSGNYSFSLQKIYTAVEDAFEKSANLFNKTGYPDCVQMVQQLVTETVAFSYFSSVIPTVKTQALLDQYCAKTPGITQQFYTNQFKNTQPLASGGYHPLTAASGPILLQQPAGPPKIQAAFPMNFGLNNGGAVQGVGQFTLTPPADPTNSTLVLSEVPDYLCRYYEQDITQLAAQEAQLAPAKKATSSFLQKNGIATDSSDSSISYASVLQNATSLLGTASVIGVTGDQSSSASSVAIMSALAKQVAIPLYQAFLIKNGYTSDFSTLNQEVARYTKQTMGLVTGGVNVQNGITLQTSYALEKRLVNQEEHIFFITHNGALAGIPTMKGQTETALLYYTLYSQFFAVVPQAVQIAGQLYYQIPDQDGSQSAEAFRGIVGTYLTHMQTYKTIIKQCMQQAPSQSLLQASQQDLQSLSGQYPHGPYVLYAPWFQLLNKAYTWVFSSLSTIDQVQQTAGIAWIHAQAIAHSFFNTYLQYMQDCSQFLVGSPTSSSYKTVLEQIAALGGLAMQYTQLPTEQQTILQELGSCYENAAATTLTYTKPMPSIDGYPSPDATNFPVSSALDLTASYTVVACLYPGACGIAALPQSYDLVWQQYVEGASYYLQAYKQYKKAYLAAPTGGVRDLDVIQNDGNSRRAWGSYILATMQEVGQKISLYGWNAIKATPAGDGSGAITLGLNPTFTTIAAQGQTDGGQSANQGFGQLQGGAVTSSNAASVQAQYGIMKNLVLDALIYCTTLTTLTGSTLDLTPEDQKKLGADPVAGKALQCGLSYFLPGTEMLVGQQSMVGQAYQAGTVGENQTQDASVETPVSLVPSQLVTIQSLGNPVVKQLLYMQTLPLFMQYCMGALMGASQGQADQNAFPLLTTTANVNGLNDFIGQVYSFAQTAYMWGFLPPTVANDPKQLGTDVTSAMQAEEQNMIVNPESYVG